MIGLQLTAEQTVRLVQERLQPALIEIQVVITLFIPDTIAAMKRTTCIPDHICVRMPLFFPIDRVSQRMPQKRLLLTEACGEHVLSFDHAGLRRMAPEFREQPLSLFPRFRDDR